MCVCVCGEGGLSESQKEVTNIQRLERELERAFVHVCEKKKERDR